MSDPDGGLQLWAGLQASIQGLGKSVASLAAKIEQGQTDTTRDFPVRASGVYPSSGSLSLAVGAPQQGRIHILRKLVIGGSIVTATPTSSAIASIQSPTDPLNLGNVPDITSLVDYTTASLPFAAFYSTRQVVLRYPDRLWVVILGGQAGVQYAVNAQWEDYLEGGYRAEINF